MINRLKIFVATIFVAMPFIAPVVVYAQQFNPGDPCEVAPGSVAESPICAETKDPITGSDSAITQAANLLTIAAGVIAVIMIMLSGITMIRSSGDPGKVKQSRDTIIYTVVGIFVVILSRSIVLFIVDRLS